MKKSDKLSNVIKQIMWWHAPPLSDIPSFEDFRQAADEFAALRQEIECFQSHPTSNLFAVVNTGTRHGVYFIAEGISGRKVAHVYFREDQKFNSVFAQHLEIPDERGEDGIRKTLGVWAICNTLQEFQGYLEKFLR